MSGRRRRWDGGKPPDELEADLQRQVLELAEHCGWELRYHTYDSTASPEGFPDLVLCKPRDGRLLIAELKSARGKLSDAQRAWNDGLKTVTHFDVHIWRPKDWDDIVKALR